eukprot:CAMPEP_0202897452 /NCGR_PEP_ID=MMETSP1392-20130828/6205_1 /ASSEMBLY_ACC=CAM_ASM_000868 /TAXON_ID=225041 /ORGANISM="Chlamydomonas chlamydogama, Strain SAG 11-48b" /LENGTH=463 /DNA_ID=CAMNT_0049583079 /DNA_START=111 /DNA_END=1502 /DNA_ORIENTATION=-
MTCSVGRKTLAPNFQACLRWGSDISLRVFPQAPPLHQHRLHRLTSFAVLAPPGPSSLPFYETTRNLSTTSSHVIPPPQRTTHVLVAVDPDTHGAIAVATWSAKSSGVSGTGSEERPHLPLADPSSISIKVYDMPCATVQLATKKSKVTGKPSIRRWLDVHAAKLLVEQSLTQGDQDLQQHHQQGKSAAGTEAAAASPQVPPSSSGPGSAPVGLHMRLWAYIEAPPIIPADSMVSRSPVMYSTGMWHGLLTMAGFRACTVPVRQWKKALGLIGGDKEDSRELARRIFPQHAHLLTLKKHHGRAEALLIAAWALGHSVDKGSGQLSTGPLQECASTDAYGNVLQYGFSDPGIDGKVVYADVQMLADAVAAEKEAAAARKKTRKRSSSSRGASSTDASSSSSTDTAGSSSGISSAGTRTASKQRTRRSKKEEGQGDEGCSSAATTATTTTTTAARTTRTRKSKEAV